LGNVSAHRWQKTKKRKRKQAPTLSSDPVGPLSDAAPADSESNIDDTLDDASNLVATDEIQQPMGQKRAKLNQLKDVAETMWQNNVAKAQMDMAKNTTKQNELLEAQTKCMKSLADGGRDIHGQRLSCIQQARKKILRTQAK
jgi:hypothetical protein